MTGVQTCALPIYTRATQPQLAPPVKSGPARGGFDENRIRGAFAQVDSAYTYFENEKKDINKRLSANPKLRSSSARLGVGDRAAGIIDALWRINTNQHAGAIAKFIADLKSQKERSVPLTEVRRRLAPPFIATDGKPLPLSELKQTP